MRGDSPRPERVIDSRRVYEGRIMAVRADTVELVNGRTATREIVEHAPVVAIVPLDENGDVVMVRQFRLATGDVMLEIPAGLVDDGEDVEDAAQRELQEETGYRAGHAGATGRILCVAGVLHGVHPRVPGIGAGEERSGP